MRPRILRCGSLGLVLIVAGTVGCGERPTRGSTAIARPAATDLVTSGTASVSAGPKGRIGGGLVGTEAGLRALPTDAQVSAMLRLQTGFELAPGQERLDPAPVSINGPATLARVFDSIAALTTDHSTPIGAKSVEVLTALFTSTTQGTSDSVTGRIIPSHSALPVIVVIYRGVMERPLAGGPAVADGTPNPMPLAPTDVAYIIDLAVGNVLLVAHDPAV